ncbi:MAG: hypothetical protein H0X38_03815 [Planctomycetes bacterium]|nr:hypothetical protein [Planctomycetota bacterium]
MADDPTIFDLLGPGQPERPAPVPDAGAGGELTGALIAAGVAALRAQGPLLPTADIPPAPGGQRVWVYDTEVFPNLVLHVFTDGRSTEVFHQGTWDALRAFVSDPGKVLAGFNSSGYDDPVLRRILAHPQPTVAEIFALSGEIIGGELPRELRWGPVPWAHGIDVLQLLNGRGSLKEWECRLGLDLVAESPCDFAAPLPASGIGEVLRYCLNDVAATVQLLLANWDLVAMRAVLQGIYGQSDTIYASTEAGIAEATMADLARRASGVTRSQLKAAAAANPDNRPRTWPLDGLIAPCVAFATPSFRALLAAVRAGSLVIGARGGALDLPQLPGQVFTHAGALYQLGTGGLHSLDQPGAWRADADTALLDLDVTSYYPSLIINEGWHPRHYGPAFVEHLRGMRDRRVAAKHAGDKRTATALKIVINSIYGKLNDAYSSIRSVPDAFRVTLNGQLLLLMLIEGLSGAGAEVLSANTDGVTARVPRAQLAAVAAAAAAWERASALTLERTPYRALYRRDVNNYLAVTEAGDLKTRGAFGDGAKGDGAVVREAAVAWLVEGVEPAESVARCSDVRAFLFYQRTRSDALLVHGERALGRIARWYVGFGGPTLRRRSLAEGTFTTVAHGHHARLAMDIAGWTMADLATLDRSAYVAEAWRLISAVAPREGLVRDA